MKEHFCPAEKSWMTYQDKCNWCGEKELAFNDIEQQAKQRKESVRAAMRSVEEDDDIQIYQRPWVGLTDDDMNDPRTHNFDFIHGARWAEAKLKERNT